MSETEKVKPAIVLFNEQTIKQDVKIALKCFKRLQKRVGFTAFDQHLKGRALAHFKLAQSRITDFIDTIEQNRIMQITQKQSKQPKT